MSVRPSNPFATRFTALGRLPFLGVSESQWHGWLATWEGEIPAAQIVGPHGSGKSTLAIGLARRRADLTFRQTGVRPLVIHHVCGDGAVRSRRFEEASAPFAGRDHPRILVVDGIHRQRAIHRWGLQDVCRRRRWPLLLTTHRPIRGLKRIADLAGQAETLERLVRHLAGDWQPSPGRAWAETLVRRHQGNLRECLMDLYDAYAAGDSG